MPDLSEHDVHVGTGAANRVVETYGLGSFIPAGFLQVLVQAILQAFLQHQAGQQQQAAAEVEPPKGKKSKTDED